MEQKTRSELRNEAMTILYQINVYNKNKINYNVEDVIKEVSLIDNEFSSNKNQYIRGNEIVFANWEKLREQKDGEWTNTLMKDGEMARDIKIIKTARRILISIMP